MPGNKKTIIRLRQIAWYNQAQGVLLIGIMFFNSYTPEMMNERRMAGRMNDEMCVVPSAEEEDAKAKRYAALLR